MVGCARAQNPSGRGSVRATSFRSALLLREGNGNGPAIGIANDGAGGRESNEGVAEALVSDAELIAKLRAGEGPRCGAKGFEETALEIAHGVLLVFARVAGREREMHLRFVRDDELKTQRIGSGRGAMLDGEEEAVLVAAHVEEGVGPGEEVSAAAKGESRLGSVAVFACMMHDEDSRIVLPLGCAECDQRERALEGGRGFTVSALALAGGGSYC